MASVSLRGPVPGRVLGLYALSAMEQDGPIYGYQLAERISYRTDGTWRPGAGAVYPALQALTRKGLARASQQAVRRVYTITPHGRALLRRIRRQMAGFGASGPDLGLLWAEIAGANDPGEHMLRHLRRHLDGIEAYLSRQPNAKSGYRSLREDVRVELRRSMSRLRGRGATEPRRPAPPRGGKDR